MKKIWKRIMGITFGIITLSMAAGCGSKQQAEGLKTYDAANNDALEQPLQIDSVKGNGEIYQAYWSDRIHTVAASDYGYYYISDDGFLMYFDKNDKESIKVCAKADCNHDNIDCNAYLGEKSKYDRQRRDDDEEYFAANKQLYVYNGKIYMITSKGNLAEISLDGSERKTIVQVCDYDGSTDVKLAFYNQYVYVYNSAGNVGSKEEHTETIQRFSLDGKEHTTIVEWNVVSGAVNNVKNYGDRLYFTTQNYDIQKNEDGKKQSLLQYQGLYGYEHKTGKVGKIIDAAITGYAIDEQNEKIYYFVYKEGLYVYDVQTQQSEKIYATDENCALSEVSYDGNYIYLGTDYWCAMSRNGAEFKDIVLDTKGNVICQIPLGEFSYSLFGDDEYLFALMSLTSEKTGKKKMMNAYLEKKDMQLGEWHGLE